MPTLERAKQMLKETEEFFKNAFCGESAKIMKSTSIDDFDVTGIIQIETGDKRGTIYIASLNTRQSDDEKNSKHVPEKSLVSGKKQYKLAQRIDDLTQLEVNWDSYNGIPVTKETAIKAKTWLNYLPDHNWSIVPGSDGSLQIEMAEQGYEIEINIEYVGQKT